MEQTTTQSPPAGAPRPAGENPETTTKPLPATEKDFHTRPSRTQSSGFRIAIVIAVVVLLVVGFFAYRYFTSYESTDDAQVDGHINSISARISGHVIKLNVEDNQEVKAGTVLVEIDPADYQVAYERAKADFDDAQAAALAAGVTVPITSVNTTSQVSSSEADVNSARAGIQAAKQQFQAAQSATAGGAKPTTSRRRTTLAATSNWSTSRKFRSSNTTRPIAAAKASAAAVEAARASADAAQQQVTQAEGKLVQAQANWRHAQTAPQQMEISARQSRLQPWPRPNARKPISIRPQLNLQYTKIVAPVNGIVSNRTVEVGQNVAPGQELMKIIHLDDIWVTANFKETQLRNMKVGQHVTIEVDANGRDYKGKVDSIAGASGARFSLLPPENATGNYVKVVQRIPVKIVLDPGENKDHSLRPGMSVTPKVWIRE